jgi:hypothetical protein
MSWNDLPGIGTATGTRVDSAAKHIMACKMDTRLLANFVMNPTSSDAINLLHNEKMKWCMHKDEIVLNTSKNNSDPTIKAYPMVITTLGDITEGAVNYIKKLYTQNNATDFFKVQQAVNGNTETESKQLAFYCGFVDDADPLHGKIPDDTKKWDLIQKQVLSLPDFRCQGVALGQAWASYLTGDTVASVLVGGMVTVQNGHFTMHTGDLVQWYFDFENQDFDHCNKKTHGRRAIKKDEHNRNRKREQYLDERLYGNSTSMGRHSGQKDITKVVRIKSYHMMPIHLTDDSDFMMDHFGDRTRVFAKCISGGRPFDAVDIMLMTQSL